MLYECGAPVPGSAQIQFDLQSRGEQMFGWHITSELNSV
jgi:hypothetical protein